MVRRSDTTSTPDGRRAVLNDNGGFIAPVLLRPLTSFGLPIAPSIYVLTLNMRFVQIRNVGQQSVLSLHRVRQGFVKARTAQANQIRGLLSESGLVIPQGIAHIARRVPELIEDAANDLSGSFRLLVER
jgi:hypothetical protein